MVPVLVLDFGEISALQYCAGNFLASESGRKFLGTRVPSTESASSKPT